MRRLARNWDLLLPYAVLGLPFILPTSLNPEGMLYAWFLAAAVLVMPVAVVRSRVERLGYQRLVWLLLFCPVWAFFAIVWVLGMLGFSDI